MIYTRELSDDDVTALEYLVPDITEWINTAISEKIANCKKRIIREYIDKAIAKDLPLPSSAAEIITAVVTDKDYKTQRQKDMPDIVPEEPALDPVPTEEIEDGQPT